MKDIKVGNKIYSGRAVIVLTILALLIFFEVRGGRSYFDEILCVIAVLYVAARVIEKRVDKEDLWCLSVMAIVIVLGVLSNIVSGLSRTIFPIFVDIVAETKVIWIFFAAKYYIDDDTRESLVKMITPFSKLFLISAFLFSILSQFWDLGMAGELRFGIKSFHFFFPMTFQFLAVGILMIAVLTLNPSVKNKRMYYLIGCVSLILAVKSAPLFFGVLFFFFLFFFKRKETIKMRTLVFVASLVVVLGGFQIRTYLMNEDAPRYLFFYYGGVTANEYFPFGAGFATFGSDQAARQYSPLYYRYGFNHLFGMNPEDGSFLSDTFWAMALGQFGWIGFVLYVGIFVLLFASLKKKSFLEDDQKAFLYATFIHYVVHAVGAAILSSSAGVIGFIAMAMVWGVKQVPQELDSLEEEVL